MWTHKFISATILLILADGCKDRKKKGQDSDSAKYEQNGGLIPLHMGIVIGGGDFRVLAEIPFFVV
jgi:hypothetical protein